MWGTRERKRGRVLAGSLAVTFGCFLSDISTVKQTRSNLSRATEQLDSLDFFLTFQFHYFVPRHLSLCDSEFFFLLPQISCFFRFKFPTHLCALSSCSWLFNAIQGCRITQVLRSPNSLIKLYESRTAWWRLNKGCIHWMESRSSRIYTGYHTLRL